MPDEFFIAEYRRKAALESAVSQTGRGSMFEAVDFLHVVREVVELLDLRREHEMLDLGCANGLLDIVLSAYCKRLVAVEPVDELAALARVNLAPCGNVEVRSGHGAALPAADSAFDRILVLEVIQLIPPAELQTVFAELRRVSRPGARVLFASVPDAGRKDRFLRPYLEGVRAARHLSEAQKAEIIERNQRANWYVADELAALWSKLDAEARRLPLRAGDPVADHRFHLIVSIGR